MTTSAACSGPALKSKLFTGLDDTTLRQVLGAAQVRRMSTNKNVIVKGERPGNLFLLQTGRAKYDILTESGSEILLWWLVPGDVAGLVSLLANPPAYLASVTTVTECEFWVWDHGAIRQMARQHPQLMENGFRIALHYLSAYVKRHVNLMTETAESRLAQTLLQLATEAGEVQSSGVAIKITNEQLGALSDIGPFTASRLLSKWEREGKLSKERGRVTLRAPECLLVA